jgi:GT2 family glycosyltransferase
MRLTICIPVYNKYAFTKSCLTDLFRLPSDIEIIVTDNASADDTQTELSKITQSNFHYIRNETNGGFAKASNQAYSNATSNNVLFLNNDIRVKDNKWIDMIIDAIEDDHLVGPTGGYVDAKNDFKFCYETSDTNKPINYMSGWCLAGNKSTFDKLNIPRENNDTRPQIFSEEFFLFYEDSDLGLRATKQGIKFKIISDFPVVHFGHISSAQLNTAKWYNISRQIFLNKWKTV